jgi:hypothetical protein
VLALLHSRNGLLSLSRTLQAQAAEHRQALVSRLQSQLTHLLTNALEAGDAEDAQQGGSNSSGSSTSSSSSSRKSPQQLRRRSVAHCLRALSALRAPEVAEDLLRSSVVGPFVR